MFFALHFTFNYFILWHTFLYFIFSVFKKNKTREFKKLYQRSSIYKYDLVLNSNMFKTDRGARK